MMKNDCTDLITLKGLVVPTRWDKEGNVTGISIAGYNERVHPVLMDRAGRSLMSLLREKVVIKGNKSKNNLEIIEVKRFIKDSRLGEYDYENKTIK